MEVIDSKGLSVFYEEKVIKTWDDEYEILYNPEESTTYDKEHMNKIVNMLNKNDIPIINNDSSVLNASISYAEMKEAVYRAKLRKAVGIDEIPSEAL